MAPRSCEFFCRVAFHLAWILAFVSGVPQAWSQAKKELKIPERERVTVSTKDGVQLSCFYYKGGFAKNGDEITEVDGKRVVPVILVHGWGGRASNFDGFAALLQSGGYAVIVPDLRGHGQSTLVNTAAGATQIDPENMQKKDIAFMWQDIEAVKGFLLEKNNAGELNIDMLALVGAKEGALVAMNWAIKDWTRPQLPAFRQGLDVKLLILLSPPAAFGPMKSIPAASHPAASKMRYFIGVGNGETTAYKDAEKVMKTLERTHRQNADEALRWVEANTELQGTDLLDERLPVQFEAARFLHASLFEHSASFPWQERPNPLNDNK